MIRERCKPVLDGPERVVHHIARRRERLDPGAELIEITEAAKSLADAVGQCESFGLLGAGDLAEMRVGLLSGAGNLLLSRSSRARTSSSAAADADVPRISQCSELRLQRRICSAKLRDGIVVGRAVAASTRSRRSPRASPS